MLNPTPKASTKMGNLNLQGVSRFYNFKIGARVVDDLGDFLDSIKNVYGYVQTDDANGNGYANIAVLPFATDNVFDEADKTSGAPNNNQYGPGFSTNKFKRGFSTNKFPSGCNNATFGAYFTTNTVEGPSFAFVAGEFCSNNKVGTNNKLVTLGSGSSYNKIGETCERITLGTDCLRNDIGDTCFAVTLGNGCQGNELVNCIGTAAQPFTLPAGTTNKRYVDGVLVGAAQSYTLPKASATVLGGIQIGTGLTIDANGKVSVSNAGPALSTTGAFFSYNPTTGVLGGTYTPENAANKNVANGYAGLDSNGFIDPARIPLVSTGGAPIISSGGLADLTSAQQALSDFNRRIITTTDGFRWQYTGSGSKTDPTNYVQLADITPEWSVIANKPAFVAVATTGNTDDLSEGNTNKFFTNARAIGATLTGYAKATVAGAITATTTIREALGLLEKKIDDLAAAGTGGGATKTVAYNVAPGVAFTQALATAHYPTVTVYDETRTVMFPVVTVAADLLSFSVDFGGVASAGNIAYN